MHQWVVNGQPAGRIANCPAVMDDPERKTQPNRWEDVPRKAYDPDERLEALDSDGVDAEVLFFNDPGRGQFFQFGYDPEFELVCIQAHNDALAEWREVSDRFVPLALIPYLSPIATIVAEVQRAANKGHRGVTLLAEPSTTVKGVSHHFNDPYWYPLWDACQNLGVPIHIHESGGLGGRLGLPRWQGYSANQFHSFLTVPTAAIVAQVIPSIIFSGRSVPLAVLPHRLLRPRQPANTWLHRHAEHSLGDELSAGELHLARHADHARAQLRQHPGGRAPADDVGERGEPVQGIKGGSLSGRAHQLNLETEALRVPGQLLVGGDQR